MWYKLFAFHLHTMLRKKSFFFALVVIVIITAAISLSLIVGFRGIDRTVLSPAWVLWNGNILINYHLPGIISDYAIRLNLLMSLIFPFLGALTYADSYYDQLRSGVIQEILSRSTRSAYYTSAALVVFLGAAVLTVVPYLFEQLLLLILCAGSAPQNAAGSSALQDNWAYITDVPTVFWGLQANHPYVFNVLESLLNALYIGAFSALTYAISLYVHINRFLVLTLPTILLWIGLEYLFSMLGLDSFTPRAAVINVWSVQYLVYFLALLLLVVLLLFGKCKKARDVLA